MHAALERDLLRRSAHVYDEKKAEINESAFALLRNRTKYIAQSEAKVRTACGPLPNRPVDRNKQLVPL